ncbi:hypothetical protein [Nocardia ignorata]|uniref:Outer membrane protein with glycine zipper n=1 Tax=Nocardia ignorata TaxID=145285 RepID=A0A4R6P2T4_NOCIG|nr:hypothetical protein [Nocardia ignorata]TDP31575.1 hypothetical protein DFR75_108180 [Nocardia ignorata]
MPENTPTARRSAARRRSGISGARRTGTMLLAAAIPVAVAVGAAGPAHANSAVATIADQGGVTSPPQPGTETPTPPPAPEPEPEPEPTPEPTPPVYYEQPQQVRTGPARPAPEVDEPVEPVRIEELHLPVPVEPVAPITPPENTIRIGEWQTPSPEWLPVEVRDTINNTAAGAEAQVATALDSVGIPAGRSDRVSGATLGGAALGGAAGATVLGAPAAAVGAVAGGLIGGTVGGIAGAALGIVIPVPIIGQATSGVAGTALGAAAGAAAGAALLGVPAGAVGGAVGATIGAGFGAGVGVGQ